MADVENTIIRTPTDNDRAYFDEDLAKSRRKKSANERFEEELGNKQLEATKKGLPFATIVAREDFKAAVQGQVDQQIRQYGRVEYPEQVKVPEMDWSKYSDLKNFEVLDEDETYDPNLTKNNPGLRVMVKKVVYKFKGYGQKYTVMEDGPSAIKRAQEKTWKAEKAVKL